MIHHSPDGKTLASVDNSCIGLWDTRQKRVIGVLGQEPPERLTQWHSIIKLMAFSPDGRFLAAGNGGSTCVWDLKTQAKVGNFYGRANSLTFSHDGKKLIVGGSDGIVLWNTDEFKNN